MVCEEETDFSQTINSINQSPLFFYMASYFFDKLGNNFAAAEIKK